MEKLRVLLVLLSSFLLIHPAEPNEHTWNNLAKQFDSYLGCRDKGLCSLRYPLEAKQDGEEVDLSEWNTTAVVAPNDMKDVEIVKSVCNCDDECGEYGDCCKDAAAVHEGRSLWSCLPLRTKDTSAVNDLFHIYMIGACPADFKEGEGSLVAMCQRHLVTKRRESHIHYSYLMDVPALSLKTNLTYANVYCARCHGDDQQLAEWDVSINCDEDYERLNISREEMFHRDNYLPGMRRWTHLVEGSNISCSIEIKQFQNFAGYITSTNARRCMPSISRCADDWTDPMDQALCSSYSLRIEDSQSKVYKNPHCAVCNSVPLADLRCVSIKPMWGVTRGLPFHSRRGFSFSMLIDFSFGEGGGGNRVGQVKRCKDNEIFDHLHNRCHAVMCGAQFINQDGSCVPKNDTEQDQGVESSALSLNSSCQRIVLYENEDYVQLGNGSIVLNHTRELLDPHEYEMAVNGSSVQICADEARQDYYFKYSKAQRLLSDICLVISVVCLTLHIGVHVALPKLRNLPGKNLLSLTCALLLAQLLFLTAIGAKMSVGYGLCASLAVITHWSYLAAFFWMNVMGFDISRTFAGQMISRHHDPVRGQRNTFRIYSLYAWGFPTLIVSIGLVLDFTHIWDVYAPKYGGHICWISNRPGLGVFFVLPIAILLLENIFLFGVTVYSILKQRRAAKYALDKNQSYRSEESKNTSKATGVLTERLNHSEDEVGVTLTNKPPSYKKYHRKQKVRFIVYVKLALIMGLGWIFGFIAAFGKLPILWYPFILFNALQGTYIFIAFDCKLKIYYMLYLVAKKHPHPADTSASSRGMGSGANKPSISSNRRTSTLVTTGLSELDRRSLANIENRRVSTVSNADTRRISNLSAAPPAPRPVPPTPGTRQTSLRTQLLRRRIRYVVLSSIRRRRRVSNLPVLLITKHLDENGTLHDHMMSPSTLHSVTKPLTVPPTDLLDH